MQRIIKLIISVKYDFPLHRKTGKQADRKERNRQASKKENGIITMAILPVLINPLFLFNVT